MKRLCYWLLLAGMGCITACAQSSPEAVLAHHVVTFTGEDWNGVIQDYAENAVFLSPDGPLEGKAKIAGFFQTIGHQSPKWKFEETVLPPHGDIWEIQWVMNRGSSNETRGRDVFVIRHAKIVFQGTYAVQPVPRARAP